jgi:signal transduction histidine kinase
VVLREEFERDKAHIESLAQMVTDQSMVQQAVEQLRAENRQLAEKLEQSSRSKSQASSQQEQSGGDFRLALEEIALLKHALAESERKLKTLKARQLSGEAPVKQRLSTIQSIIQDLRDPVTSISGYAESLLGETGGKLSKGEVKELERIKASTERMSHMVDELLQVTTQPFDQIQSGFELVDLKDLINQAVHETSPETNAKQVQVVRVFPDSGIELETDPKLLLEALILLIQNASEVSPRGGRVEISARVDEKEAEQAYVLIQIADSGSGVDLQDLPAVFALEEEGVKIQGLGIEPSGMKQVRLTIEDLGGRIWMDSPSNSGAVVNILIPKTYAGNLKDHGE